MKNRILNLNLIFILLISVFASVETYAQQLDNKGKEFWIAFPGNNSASGSRVLFITGDVATTGTVSIPGLAFSSPFTVEPDSITEVMIPLSADIQSTDLIENKGIHITALDEVTVYGLNQLSATTDAYLALPLDILGKSHYVMAYRGDVSFSGKTQFTVVATQDSTIVTITSSFSSGPRVAGVPYQITLHKGQTYQLRGNDQLDDASGTKIVSDKPIAVFGGAQCTNIYGSFRACDHIVEQIPPASTLGKQFVTIPLATRLNGDTYRFLATSDSTEIRVNGVLEANLDAGQFFEKIYAMSIEIVSTKPIVVAQFSNSSGYDGVTSDPFMMLIPPFEQYLGSYTLSTPASGFVGHYLNIVAPSGGIASVELDGSFIPSSDFAQIGSSSFFGATKLVAAGTHTVKSSFPVGVHSYGFGSFDSYGYPGGQSLSEVASADSLQLSLTTGIAPQGDTVCVAEATVLDSLNQPLSGIRVDFSLHGVNAMSGFAFTDSLGVATYCYLATNAGFDTVKASTGGLSATGVVEILPCALNLSATFVNIINGSPGSIDLTVTGNVAAATYTWTGPNGFAAATQDLSGLTDSGTYKVVVRDPFFSNCKDSLYVTVKDTTIGGGGGNCDVTCLSDGSWSKSTVVSQTNNSGIWMGVQGVLPAAATFTDPAVVGQPYPWVHVTPVAGADPIKTGHSITYFRKTFNLTTTSGIEARFRMNVDDQAEIYVNGQLVARLVGMGRANYRNPYHDARFYGAGAVDNGYLGGDMFDFTTNATMSSVFQVGTNELIVVVRNLGKVKDKGGFSMRMDLTGCGGLIPKAAIVSNDHTTPHLDLYPNPNNGEFVIALPSMEKGTVAQIRVYDMNGRLIAQQEETSEMAEVNISGMTSGVYFVKVNVNGIIYTEKVIRQ